MMDSDSEFVPAAKTQKKKKRKSQGESQSQSQPLPRNTSKRRPKKEVTSKFFGQPKKITKSPQKNPSQLPTQIVDEVTRAGDTEDEIIEDILEQTDDQRSNSNSNSNTIKTQKPFEPSPQTGYSLDVDGDLDLDDKTPTDDVGDRKPADGGSDTEEDRDALKNLDHLQRDETPDDEVPLKKAASPLKSSDEMRKDVSPNRKDPFKDLQYKPTIKRNLPNAIIALDDDAPKIKTFPDIPSPPIRLNKPTNNLLSVPSSKSTPSSTSSSSTSSTSSIASKSKGGIKTSAPPNHVTSVASNHVTTKTAVPQSKPPPKISPQKLEHEYAYPTDVPSMLTKEVELGDSQDGGPMGMKLSLLIPASSCCIYCLKLQVELFPGPYVDVDYEFRGETLFCAACINSVFTRPSEQILEIRVPAPHNYGTRGLVPIRRNSLLCSMHQFCIYSTQRANPRNSSSCSSQLWNTWSCSHSENDGRKSPRNVKGIWRDHILGSHGN
eukprot:TRINITY_DN3735_c0_g1_i3.p1 TRINITY_DN3735_c0_g1~~TRINITY_DN3735_c0_g1_i3.p1  ORF type:complete len:492 (-),score=151.68 TRINITY_DN3735_c0_g1_i3:1003-2478(-)